MNCLSKEELQMFLDHELFIYKRSDVEEHINSCICCKETYQTLWSNKEEIFKMLDELTQSEENIEIPAFLIPERKLRFVKALKIAAAAAIFLVLLWSGNLMRKAHLQRIEAENIAKASIDVTRNLDPNQMMQKKQIVIIETNSSGDVIQSTITE